MFLFRSLIIVLAWCIICPGAVMADRVVAVVNGKNIMESELNEFTADIPQPFKVAFKKQALKRIIDIDVFYNLGVKSGILNSSIYKKKIDKARHMIVSNLFIERKLKSRIRVSDKQIRAYYEHNKARFNGDKKILMGYIAVSNKDFAATLRRRIKAGSFEKVADTIGRNARNARYFRPRWIERGKSRMPPRFENFAFELRKGMISPVVHTRMGYDIIKVFDVKPGRHKGFAEIKNKIRARLVQEQLLRLKQEYLKAARVRIIAKEYR